jgi:hypothetical protein
MQTALTRILFVFASVCPNVSYFQGLNEVPIPFFVAYLNGRDVDILDGAELGAMEADVFWSLFRVMEPVFRATGAVAQKIHAVDQTQVGVVVNEGFVLSLKRCCPVGAGCDARS